MYEHLNVKATCFTVAFLLSNSSDPVNIYVLKVSNRNTRKRREICSKLTIKTPEQRY